jgi:drug/metabolite transporter (DMT)-like permease
VPVAALLALVSSVMWGTADFLGGVLTRRLPVLAVYGLSQAVGFVVLVVAATVAGRWGADPGYWPWAIAASLLGLVAMLAFYQALAIGPMGIVSPLVSLSVLVPVAVALLRGEVPSSLQILGIIAAIVGILLASGPELSGAESARPLVLAGIAALGFGGMFVFMAEGSTHDPLMTMVGMRVTTMVIFAGVLVVTRSLGGATARDVGPIAAIGTFDAAANVLFGFATTLGLLATTAVLGDLYAVVTAILAAIFLRERLRAVQYAGVAAAIAGVLLISSGA